MNTPISNNYGAVTSGADRAAGSVPTTNSGRPVAPGADPRLAAAVETTADEGRRSQQRTRDRSEKTKKYTSGIKELQEKGGRDVSSSGRSGDAGTSSGSGSGKGTSGTPSGPSSSQMPQMPQTPQTQTPQAAPPSVPSPAPGGVQRIDPQVLAALVQLAQKRKQEAANSGEIVGIGPDHTAGSTQSGKGSATSPQQPQKLDISQVSFDKYPGGPLTPQQTADVIDQALTINGIPNDPALRAQWQELYQHMSQNESTNNPNAGNDDDSNATGETQVDGLPANSSRGQWQCIPSTFANWHMAGTSNSIYDPVASAAASMNYVMDTYKVSPTGEGLEAFMTRQGVGSGSYLGY